jgi:Glycosyl transferases group 1
MVPNKGHATLLRILHSYRLHVSRNLVIRLVGGWDKELANYRAELETLVEELDLGACVDFLPHVSQDELVKLLRTSHVYIGTSYHEGFCIPLIEAQASGLPIVVMDTTAVRATVGEGQLVAPEPRSDADYRFYAKLLDELFTNPDLRRTVIRKGYRNVTTRFTRELIENQFVEALLPFFDLNTWRQAPSSSEGASWAASFIEHPFAKSANWTMRFDRDRSELNTEIGRFEGPLLVSDGTRDGFVQFGPYVSVSSGKYQANWWGQIDTSHCQTYTTGHVDATTQRGVHEIAKGQIGPRESGQDAMSEGLIASLEFCLDHPTSDLELRLWTHQGVRVVLSHLTLERLGEEA